MTKRKKEQTRNNSKIMLIFAKTTPTRKYSKLKTIDKMHILRKTQRNCAHPKSTECKCGQTENDNFFFIEFE